MVSEVETNPLNFDDWDAVYRLLIEAYAYMEGRIDPPSFLTHMSVEDVAAKATAEDFYLIRDGRVPIACMFGHVEGDAYEVGKLAVSASRRREGLARRMIDVAANRARHLGLGMIQLYARVELTENHDTYKRMGFTIARPFAHPGFDRPTAIIMKRAL